ncbi:hypothetical protein ACFYRK_21085 [Streptomyces sp. NPDC005381]|uniref:hypothetical protein n=1 Tax=Streptomyces sp. NPDC005381 TaxID=3364714 RepID=UPI0036CC1C1D
MPAHQTVDGLPHLADQEYTMVVRSAHQLVKATLTELEIRFPPMRRYTEEQHRRTADDLRTSSISWERPSTWPQHPGTG